MKSKKEIALLNCRIVTIISFLDDDGDIPWHYVERSGDGRFKAIVSHVVPGEPYDYQCEHSLGLFAEEAKARAVLYDFRHREWERMTRGFRALSDAHTNGHV